MTAVKTGGGGELHPTAETPADRMTTNNGVVISDDQNSLKAGVRGPSLLEDLFLREKITHFDHERIPERVVHARGYGVKGFFQCYEGNADLTCAEFLTNPKTKTSVFCRFSTVAGSSGSPDCARDVRGFAVKFYTSQGNYDLVGNNIPVFFIQDAIKFPDLIHSVKPEQDRGFPQAQSAHNTFWDFISLTPESMHMIMWVMSDRGIPRSLRMMEGFGVHTFRMVNSDGKAKFVKFHWRPKLGTFSLLWAEALVINGADPDFHRRDMWDAIASGDFPEWELSVQEFTEQEAEEFDFDVLDATKLIPEELIPLRPIGKMILNENVDNFFAETEQIAFCPANLVPGIELSDDPLLQGRLFSYLDTQLSRLGGPNFSQIPVNAPRCPWQNLQRDGHMQMMVPKGPVANSPQSLEQHVPSECPVTGFKTFPAEVEGQKLRMRPESFADHYTQARMFFRSLRDFEQRHIVDAIAFELGKCSESKVRLRVLSNLQQIDISLWTMVAKDLGHDLESDDATPSQTIRDTPLSDALSQYKKAPLTLAGKKIGVLLTEGCEAIWLEKLRKIAKKEKAKLAMIAVKPRSLRDSEGNQVLPDDFLAGAPSALFDCVVIAPTKNGELDENAHAVDWIRMAFAHLKVIGFTAGATGVLAKAGVATDMPGVHELTNGKFTHFIDDAKKHRIWSRGNELNAG